MLTFMKLNSRESFLWGQNLSTHYACARFLKSFPRPENKNNTRKMAMFLKKK